MEPSGLSESTSAGELQAPPAPEVGRCPAPANLRAEVARYDRNARVDAWEGPRYRVNYRILGDGPPLILIPGIAATYRVYALLLNLLSERFRTIIYEFPGDQRDDGAALNRLTHDDMVSDFLGLIDHLKIDSICPVGLSFGSSIVLKALEREPRRFPRAVVQGAFASRDFSLAERAAFSVGRRFPGTLGALPFRERILKYNFRHHFPRLIENRWDFYVEQNGLTPIRSLAHRLSLLKTLDLRPILGRISQEVLVLQGNEDRLINRMAHEELVKGITTARSVIMPNVGHQPHLTHAEALAHVISQWFLPCEPTECAHEGDAGTCSGMPGGCLGEGNGACQAGGGETS